VDGRIARLVGEGRLVKIISNEPYSKYRNGESVAAIIWRAKYLGEEVCSIFWSRTSVGQLQTIEHGLGTLSSHDTKGMSAEKQDHTG
jgi:hypothetical protein